MTPAQLACTTAPKRNSWHWKPGTITWQEILDWCAAPASKKEAGNYVLGTLRETTVAHDPRKPTDRCTDYHRRKDAVVSRSALTLDSDTPERGFAEKIELLCPWRALLHTTFSSSPDAPRYRLIIPLDREVTPDEYIACCETVLQLFGSDNFDPGTTQPERYMFRPAAQQPEWFAYWSVDGPVASADALLAHWDPDLSAKPLPAPHRNKRDPYTLEGVIGAFNRAYEDWDLLIDTYALPYDKVSDDRYQLVGSAAQAGMGPIPETGFVYSHHANDPAFGQTCSAFDLVRLHRFGHLDEDVKKGTPVNKLPSQVAMKEEATQDPRVTAEIAGMDFATAVDDEGEITPEGWQLRFERYRAGERAGTPKDSIRNWDLLRAHDPVLLSVQYNEMTLSPEFDEDVPWRKVTPTTRIITENDRWEFVDYIDRTYRLRVSKSYADSRLDGASWQRVVNPVRDYLSELVWDGVPRVETSLPGVRPTPYTRLVARKVMVAAVARMFEPGKKWDHVPVFVGDEGLGKTWYIQKLGRGFTAPLGRIDNKDTLMICQQSWIVTADENHSMRKADQDAQKEFITRTADLFRMPYDRETLVHPRHWVVWSTTNDLTFLTRQQGNRRYLVVNCQDAVDFDSITDAYVDQLWAEAVYMYRAGEPLFLNADESGLAASHREPFVEEDMYTGLILEYLETKVPADWWERRPEARQQWLFDRAAGFEGEGTMTIDRVCSAQIWVEALNRRKGDARRADLTDITNILKRLPGWRAAPGRGRMPGYGTQLVFVKDDLL